MNFCVCRKCHSCKYRGYKDTEPYCVFSGKDIHKIKKCPNDYKNRDEFGNEVKQNKDINRKIN